MSIYFKFLLKKSKEFCIEIWYDFCMTFGLNWVDLAIILFLAVFSLEAVGKPLMLELLDLISFFLAFFVSFRYYNFPAKYLETQFYTPHGLSLVLGFMIMWFLSEIIFYLAVRLFIPRFPIIKFPGSKILSAAPAFLRSLIFIALTLVLIGTFPIQPRIKQAVLDSKLGSVILENAYQLEEPVKNVFGGVTNDTLTFLTIKPETNERVNLGFQTDKFSISQTDENNIIDLVNKERTSRGIKALKFDSKLREVAREHSADMFKRGYFSHYSPEGKTVADRAASVGVDFLVIGENLAYAPSLELAHKGLMNSDGHRANILSTDYVKIGVGVMDGGIYGKIFTQVFSN